MASKTWREATLGDEIDLLTGFPFESKYYTESPDGIRLVRGDNVVQAQIRWDGVKRWPKDQTTDLAQYFLSPGDVVLAMDRPWIEAGLKYACLTQDDAPALLVQRVARLRGRANLHTKFLRYVIGSPAFTQHVQSIQTGTAVPHISGAQIRQFKFRLPPLPEQRAIAGVLGALDDKIEVNRKTARVLEGIARAVFTSWFVDFDPVRRAAAGRPTGLPAELAALFPKRMVASAIGEVPETPEGWTASVLADHFELTMGQSPPGSTYNEVGAGLPFYQGRTDFGFRFPTPRVYCTAPTRLAQPGDTLVSVRAPVGDVNMAIVTCTVGRGVAAVRHKSGSRSLTYYAMHALRSHFLRFEADGTVFGAIGKTDFERLPFVAPPQPVVDAFERFAAPIDQRIEGCECQSSSLAALRDALLPKLISGELRIADAEKTVGGIV